MLNPQILPPTGNLCRLAVHNHVSNATHVTDPETPDVGIHMTGLRPAVDLGPVIVVMNLVLAVDVHQVMIVLVPLLNAVDPDHLSADKVRI